MRLFFLVLVFKIPFETDEERRKSVKKQALFERSEFDSPHPWSSPFGLPSALQFGYPAELALGKQRKDKNYWKYYSMLLLRYTWFISYYLVRWNNPQKQNMASEGV